MWILTGRCSYRLGTWQMDPLGTAGRNVAVFLRTDSEGTWTFYSRFETNHFPNVAPFHECRVPRINNKVILWNACSECMASKDMFRTVITAT